MPSSILPCADAPQVADARRIRCFTPVCSRLASGGQPTMEQIAGLRHAGYEVVINLLPMMHDKAMENEAETVRENGMRYEQIPVVWTKPAQEDITRFFAVMDECAQQNRRVFVHCAVNMRASAFLYLWRTLHGGVDVDDAEADLHDVWVPEGWWAEFIADVTRTQQGRGTV